MIAKYIDKRVTEYGLKWNPLVPRASIHWLMQKQHVSMSDEEVEHFIRERCMRVAANNSKMTAGIMKQAVRYALLCHKHNRELYTHVARGIR